MSSNGICDFCIGSGKNWFNEVCTFCNGTGNWNQSAQDFLNSHICQCEISDRKFCPVCKLECHHDTSLSPKQTIDPGWGGSTCVVSTTASDGTTVLPPLEEEMFVT